MSEPTLQQFFALAAQLPKDVYLKIGTEPNEREEGDPPATLRVGLYRIPPEGGWPTEGDWAAATSPSGNRSCYSKESGLNPKPPRYRFDRSPLPSTTGDPESPQSVGLVMRMIQSFLRQHRDGDDPIAGGGGEVLDPARKKNWKWEW